MAVDVEKTLPVDGDVTPETNDGSGGSARSEPADVAAAEKPPRDIHGVKVRVPRQ